MSTATIVVPVAIGSRRTVQLVARGDGTCRECGEEILRVSSQAEDIWIHRGRTRGRVYAHQARSKRPAR